MNEVDAMKAEFAKDTAAMGSPTAPADSILAQERKKLEALKEKKKDVVQAAQPVQPVATATVSYRDPATGEVRSTQVQMRVLLKVDDRALLHRIATACLTMAWGDASTIAQMEAYDTAMCILQWDEVSDVPAWFKQAYMQDSALAAQLTREVEALTEAYFRGHDGEGRVVAERRFLVTRS